MINTLFWFKEHDGVLIQLYLPFINLKYRKTIVKNQQEHLLFLLLPFLLFYPRLIKNKFCLINCHIVPVKFCHRSCLIDCNILFQIYPNPIWNFVLIIIIVHSCKYVKTCIYCVKILFSSWPLSNIHFLM